MDIYLFFDPSPSQRPLKPNVRERERERVCVWGERERERGIGGMAGRGGVRRRGRGGGFLAGFQHIHY